MDKNQIYIQNLKVDEVPWHRMTTAYGRAAGFPKHFNTMWDMADKAAVKAALHEVTANIEHQSTLWHATPFAVIFLVRIFEHAVSEMGKNEIADFMEGQLLDFFILIAECFHDGDEMEHAQQLPAFSDMLREEYLWSEEYDEEQDELRYEEDELFPDDLFYSFWYYSYQALLPYRPMWRILEDTFLHAKAKKLQELL